MKQVSLRLRAVTLPSKLRNSLVDNLHANVHAALRIVQLGVKPNACDDRCLTPLQMLEGMQHHGISLYSLLAEFAAVELDVSCARCWHVASTNTCSAAASVDLLAEAKQFHFDFVHGCYMMEFDWVFQGFLDCDQLSCV